MAGPFFVDDAGDGTTEDSWATADTSINALDAEYTFASGEIVYFGADMQCQATNAASLTITGPTSGAPVYFISSTVGSGTTVSYSASTSNQIDTSEAATYDISFDGTFALYGISLLSGRHVLLTSDADERITLNQCNFKLGAAGQVTFNASNQAFDIRGLHVDLTNDGTTNRSAAPFVTASTAVNLTASGLTFTNAAYRTGTVFQPGTGSIWKISGSDFSGFTNATACEIATATAVGISLEFSNCLTAATWTPISGALATGGRVSFYNCGPADAPTALFEYTFAGSVVSTTSIYRSSGATIETEATSWLITTTASCNEAETFKTPWIYGTVSSTGSKTFTLYITNDTADFTDAQVWLEVEFLGTADEAVTSSASDQRVITDAAVAQTDDVTSTWNGAGPSYTYKQSLAVTATVNETGMYRARVVVGVASIAGSRYFYVDPLVTVS